MTKKEQEVLDFINRVIIEEHGNRVTLDSTLSDASLDSFGTTVLFIEINAEYNVFKDVVEGTDPFSTINWDTITIKEIVNKCL